MTVEVLVYEGFDADGRGLFGHVLGTDHTYRISYADPDWGAYGEVDGGFVYVSDRDLMFSDGWGAAELTHDANGALLPDPHGLARLGDETVFWRDPVFGGAMYITDGDGAPIPLGLGVDAVYRVGDALIVRDGSFLIRLDEGGETTTLVNWAEIPDLTWHTAVFFVHDDALWIRAKDESEQGIGIAPFDFFIVDPETGAVSNSDLMPSHVTTDAGLWARSADTKLYFWVNSPGLGRELHVTDGTEGGTKLVADINPGSAGSEPNRGGASGVYSAALGDTLIFVADDGAADGNELWVSDGTAEGTFALSGTGTALGPLEFSGGMKPVAVGDQLFFSAWSQAHGRELYVTDGTIDGTRVVADLVPGAGSSTPADFVSDGTYLYFSPEDGPDFDAYFRTDGTAEGTVKISDLTPDVDTANDDAFDGGIVSLDPANLPEFEVDGTDDPDEIVGTALRERIEGKAGDDDIGGGDGDDRLFGQKGDDDLRGEDGDDLLDGDGGDDDLRGGDGEDVLKGDKGADELRGGDGDDRLFGGKGNDDIRGGNGDDFIAGERHGDIMRGGEGADVFAYLRTDDSPKADRDTILDFETGTDLIDLSVLELDATFVAKLSGTGGAEIRLAEYGSGAGTRVSIDVDGDGAADMQINLAGVDDLTQDDFLL